MRLTCLSKGSGFHFPPCHVLDVHGFRILFDCPLDLSALPIFSPINCTSSKAPVLIPAVPRYKTVKDLHLWDASLFDVVLVSSPAGMLGLPFLTRNGIFSGQIFATEATARIGKIMMGELVSMHEEFVRFYGSEEDVNFPEWMKPEELQKLPANLKEVVMGQTTDNLGSWQPLYSAEDICECLKKVEFVKYAEEYCHNGALVLKALSSGLELGTANWKICSPSRTIIYLSSSSFMSSHATKFDYHAILGNDVVLFSDFSSLHTTNDNDATGTDMCDEQVLPLPEHKDLPSVNIELRERFGDDASIAEKSYFPSESFDEVEKVNFTCSCILDSINEGGSVLIPIGRLSIILQLLEKISESLKSLDLKVPIYMISPLVDETLAFVNAAPEWLNEKYQEKLFSGEPLFPHMELIREKKLNLYPNLYSSTLPMTWNEPCIVFSPHWSLRFGPVVQLLRHWHANEKCLLVLEQGIDTDIALSVFEPFVMKVLQCSFLSGIMTNDVYPLLEFLQPNLILFPEDLRTCIPSIKVTKSSFLYYSENIPLDLPRQKEEYEAYMATELAFQLQPRKTKQESIVIARLHGNLGLSNGKLILLPGRMAALSGKRLQLGSVDSILLQQRLKEKGMTMHATNKDVNSTDCDDYSVDDNGSEVAKIQIKESGTSVNTAGHKNIATNIYEVFTSVSEGI